MPQDDDNSRRSTRAADVLGGAVPKRQRQRGFVNSWQPQAQKRRLLEQVQAVMEEYREHLPLTIRQVFYRLVAKYDFPKTESAYKNQLCELMTMARRAKVISMDDIRDDTVAQFGVTGFADKEDFLDWVREEAEAFTLDRTIGQRTRLAVLCEAAGMAPQLSRVAGAYGVPVKASGGFDSLTSKHDLAKEIANDERPMEILHVGDHDPSGGHMFVTLMEDVTAFAADMGGSVIFTRIAVTPAQIRQHRLPTAPPKPTDNRAFAGMTCQAEALAPDVMNAIVRDAIEQRVDMDQLRRTIEREQQERDELMDTLDNIE
jgi:hypothetical protein